MNFKKVDSLKGRAVKMLANPFNQFFSSTRIATEVHCLQKFTLRYLIHELVNLALRHLSVRQVKVKQEFIFLDEFKHVIQEKIALIVVFLWAEEWVPREVKVD